MPHQCTNCQRSFADGSKQMLSGCPDCGGKKFQFIPSGKASPDDSVDEPDTSESPSPSPDPDADRGHDGTESTPDDFDAWPEESTTTASSSSSTSPPPTPDEDGIIEAPDEPVAEAEDAEDLAQADARRTFVTDDELPDHDEGTVADIPDAEEPSLSDLRAELNNQFESIKVLEPGQYELNLMELYDRPEHIIAIEEDGRYVIDVADVGERTEQ